MKKFITAAAVVLFYVCGAEASMLRAGTDGDFQPYEYYQSASGTYTGFDVELTEALAKLMGYDGVEFVATPFDELLPGLDEDRYDIAVAALIVTEERKREADFSAPYAEDRSVVVVLKEGAEGACTAAEKGTVHMEYALKNCASDGEIIATDGAEESIALLLSKKAARAVTSKLSADYLNANVYGGRLSVERTDSQARPLAIAVRRGNGALLAKLNEALALYKKSADFDRLRRTYFGARR